MIAIILSGCMLHSGKFLFFFCVLSGHYADRYETVPKF
jgi:hypothetical protein